MAVVLAVQHWRQYLLERKFLIHSDQQSLKHLLEQRITTKNQQMWIAKLLGFRFENIYKLGKENKVADALSRKHEGGVCSSLCSFPIWNDMEKVQEEILQDQGLQKII